MIHVVAFLRTLKGYPKAAKAADPDRDSIIARPLTPADERRLREAIHKAGQEEQPDLKDLRRLEAQPTTGKLAVLAAVELVVPAAGLLGGLQFDGGAWWWLFLLGGLAVSCGIGYAFRRHVPLAPLDFQREGTRPAEAHRS